MTPSLTAILAALGILWAIVQVIVQASAKKKEQERLAALARRRREEVAMAPRQNAPSSQFASRPVPHPSAPAVAPPVTSPTSQLDELRRRRAAQLEDLRRRKQQADATRVQVQIAPASTSTTSHAPAMRRGPGPGQPLPMPAMRKPPARMRPGPAMAAPPQPPRPLVTSPQARTTAAVSLQPLIEENVEGPSAPLRRTAPPPARAQQRPRSRAIKALALDRSSLRRAVILKEILDMPAALRDRI